MSHRTLKMGDRGRLVIPSDVRSRLGLKAGDTLAFEEAGRELRIRRLDDRIDDLRGTWANLAPSESLAEELIAERRAEAARE